MISSDPRATAVFEKDVQDTYAHLVERVRISKAEQAAAGEQIQLMPENPDVSVSFNVPEGPPPEELELEGPGFENVTVEEVRKALQMRWDVFSGFGEAMREALKSQRLEEVNRVLGEMQVEDAEEVVRLLDLAGILNFGERGIVDETGKGKGKAVDDEEEEEEDDEEEGADEVD